MSRRAGGRHGDGASATDGGTHGRDRPSPPAAVIPAPMLAMVGSTLPVGPPGAWVFEPKYDGIRVVAALVGGGVTLAMRSGRDAAVAFPEIVGALDQLARLRRGRGGTNATLVLDGEIVALDGGLPARFAALQPRLFVASPIDAASRAREIPTAFVAFDCLVLDGRSIVDRPWRERRAALETVLARWQGARLAPDVRGRLRLSTVTDDGAALLEAQRLGRGEGVIAKNPQAPYQPGRRAAAWRKVRLETIDEFAVLGVVAESGEGARPAPGGAAPRLPRRIGALVLGEVDAAGALRVVGTVGSGLGGDAAAELARRLASLVRGAPADGVVGDVADASGRWSSRRAALPAVTWVEPAVVVSVRYLERTAHGRLRQPVFVGIRADLSLRDLLRAQRLDGAPAAPAALRPTPAPSANERAKARPSIDGPSPMRVPAVPPAPPVPTRPTARPRIVRASDARDRNGGQAIPHGALAGVPEPVRAAADAARAAIDEASRAAVGERARLTVAIPDVAAHAAESLDAGAPHATPLVDACGWTWTIGGTVPLSVTHLAKPIGDGVVKADLLRYYADVSPYLLRALAGRPLVLRRHTDPAAGRAFYQQHVNAATPAGVATARLGDDEKPRFVGGALATLLYLVQLGAVSMDPWHGRVDGLSLVDYSIIDLDPGPDAPFARVVDVARWVHDELLTLGLASVPKTSGATGIHVVVPLPGDTPADAARLLAELVASQVAGRHRAAATVVRSVRARPSGTVYVDYLQNIPGKTVASVYAARATPTLTVSTPLRWDEVTPRLDPRDWTIRTVPPRLAEIGDLWGDAMLRGNDLEALRRVLRSGDRREAGG